MSQAAPEAFRYTPGNGYVYKWDGGPYVRIFQVFNGWDAEGTNHRSERETPDVIEVPADMKRTAGALAALVDSWRDRGAW